MVGCWRRCDALRVVTGSFGELQRADQLNLSTRDRARHRVEGHARSHRDQSHIRSGCHDVQGDQGVAGECEVWLRHTEAADAWAMELTQLQRSHALLLVVGAHVESPPRLPTAVSSCPALHLQAVSSSGAGAPCPDTMTTSSATISDTDRPITALPPCTFNPIHPRKHPSGHPDRDHSILSHDQQQAIPLEASI